MFYIDASHHQGKIDFKKLLTNVPKIDGIYIKATQGVGYTDPMLKANCTSAAIVGIDFGFYHYATLNTNNFVHDAIAEAKYFVSIIKQLPSPKLPIALDIEENKAHLSPTEVVGWIKAFFSELTRLGYENHILYSYTPFLNSNLPDKHGLGNIPLWIAHYTTKAAPSLPKGWDKFFLWQYSAKGRIAAIKGEVDFNKGYQE